MQNPNTVILGEASEESDTEEIALDCDQEPSISDVFAKGSVSTHTSTASQKRLNRGGLFGSKLFSPSGAIAKLANYTPYNLLQTSLIQTTGGDVAGDDSDPVDSNHMAPLHRTLFAKNRQFQDSLIHLHKHPLQTATKSVHSINQRLVQDQKLIQELDDAMSKLKREQNNLDIKIHLIA